MRGDVVLCATVSSVEAARRACLSHGKVKVSLVLLGKDALHLAVIHHPFVCVGRVWWYNGSVFFVVHVFRGGRGYLKYLDLYLQGSMSGNLGRHVVVLRLWYLDGCRVCVAEVGRGICLASLLWSVQGLASQRACEFLQAHVLHGHLHCRVFGHLSPPAIVR